MRLVSLIIFWSVLTTACFANSVVIYNDSSFILQATILSADGKKKASLTIAPQQQSSWQDPYGSNHIWSQTPYEVIFNCKNGKQYGIVSQVAPGAWVTASQATGPRYCEIKKNTNQKKTQNQEQQSDVDMNPPYDGEQQYNTQKNLNHPLPPDQQHDLDLGPPTD